MGTRRPPKGTVGARGRETAGTAVTGRIIRWPIRTALVLWMVGRRRYATSQASGMVSVSRARPIQIATSASAGPDTRCSSARVAASATLT